MDTSIGIEKRKYERLPYIVPTTISFSYNGKQVTVQGFSRNISVGGMGVEFNSAVIPIDISEITGDTILKMELEIPSNDKKIAINGLIRWCQFDQTSDKIYVGILFSENKSDIALTLFNYVKRELAHHSSGKTWFIAFLLTTLSLGVWGIQLYLVNNSLINQILEFDILRLTMERQLIALRNEKISTEFKLRQASEDQVTLAGKLTQLKEKTIALNTGIVQLNKQLQDTSSSLEPAVNREEIDRLKKVIEEKVVLNNSLQDQINYIQQKVDENEKIVASARSAYETITTAFQNRLKTKKLLDKEIGSLMQRTRIPATKLGPSGYADLPRGVWVLNEELFKFSHKTDELLAFCVKKNINLIFAQLNLDKSLAPDQYPDFLQAAHCKGIQVHAYYVMKQNEYASYEENYRTWKNWRSKIIAYNKAHDESARFDGINVEIDNSPAGTEATTTFKSYLESFQKLIASRNEKNFPLMIGVTVKQASNDTKTTVIYNNKSANINLHLLDIVDYLIIENPSTPTSAKNEVRYASSLGKKVLIGQQITVDDSSYKPSRSGEYIHNMELDISRMIEYYLDEPGFMGVSIHEYSAYRQCIEDNTPEYVKDEEAPVISVRPPEIDYKAPVATIK